MDARRENIMNPYEFDAIVAVKVGRWCELHQDERVKYNEGSTVYCDKCLEDAADSQDEFTEEDEVKYG